MQHELKTINDIIKVLNKENIENFKIDFCSFLDMIIEMKTKLNRVIDIKEVEIINKFIWIDDGKHDKKITFILK